MRRASREELKRFLGSFSPEVAKIALRARALVLTEAPMAEELVSDVRRAELTYGLTERAADAFCRIVVHDDSVDLGFGRKSARSDSRGAPEKSGRAPRHLRLEDLDDLRRPQVGILLRAAMKEAAAAPKEEP